MKRKFVSTMLALTMAVSLCACSSKEATSSAEASVSSEKESTGMEKAEESEAVIAEDSEENTDATTENAYGLTAEETATLVQLVRDSVTTGYLEKYEIDPASFSLPEYVPGEADNLWRILEICLESSGEVDNDTALLSATTSYLAGLKEEAIQSGVEKVENGEYVLQSSWKEAKAHTYQGMVDAGREQDADLIDAVYTGIASFLNGLDVERRMEILIENFYRIKLDDSADAITDDQGNYVHTMIDQVICENISFS